MTAVRDFVHHHYRHFNAAALVDAADGYVRHLDQGGVMFMTLAGAMSTAELGLSLAEMIRRDKVQAICCTGANLEEDVFNLVAHEHYVRVPHYRQLTAKDALAAHAEVELGIDPDDLTSAWNAAIASMVSFTIGALLPLLVVVFVPPSVRIVVTVASVMAALALTGWASARFGYGSARRAVLRNVGGGLLAMAVTHLVGQAVGTQV